MIFIPFSDIRLEFEEIKERVFAFLGVFALRR